jgi:hypothetical protein
MFSGVPVNLITEISGLIHLRESKLLLSYKTLYKELFFNDSKKTNEGVLIKEPIHINDWLSVDSCNEAECIKEKDFHKTVTLED